MPINDRECPERQEDLKGDEQALERKQHVFQKDNATKISKEIPRVHVLPLDEGQASCGQQLEGHAAMVPKLRTILRAGHYEWPSTGHEIPTFYTYVGW